LLIIIRILPKKNPPVEEKNPVEQKVFRWGKKIPVKKNKFPVIFFPGFFFLHDKQLFLCITKMAYCEAQPSQNASAASPKK
jgi:hypothetical protein